VDSPTPSEYRPRRRSIAPSVSRGWLDLLSIFWPTSGGRSYRTTV